MENTEKITKDILAQYCDLRKEVKDVRKRVQKLKDDLARLEKEGNVIDCVKGGNGGIQSYKIEGFPYPEYTRKKTALITRMAILSYMEAELLELANGVEEYIQSIDSSRIRRILRYRYIDDLSWIRVALSMGGSSTEDSVRKEHDRFLERERLSEMSDKTMIQ